MNAEDLLGAELSKPVATWVESSISSPCAHAICLLIVSDL